PGRRDPVRSRGLVCPARGAGRDRPAHLTPAGSGADALPERTWSPCRNGPEVALSGRAGSRSAGTSQHRRPASDGHGCTAPVAPPGGRGRTRTSAATTPHAGAVRGDGGLTRQPEPPREDLPVAPRSGDPDAGAGPVPARREPGRGLLPAAAAPRHPAGRAPA